MKMKFYNILSIVVIAMFLLACNNGPKVITSNETPSGKYDSGIFSEEDTQTIEAPMESGGLYRRSAYDCGVKNTSDRKIHLPIRHRRWKTVLDRHEETGGECW